MIITTYRQPDDAYHGKPSTSNDFKVLRLRTSIEDISPTPDIMGGYYNLPQP
eukprot:UN12365